MHDPICFWSNWGQILLILYASLDQLAKNVVSDSLGLVDFAIGLVNPVLYLPEGQVKFFGKFRNSDF